jgi:CheY-like chemotaxis protein
MQVLDLVMPGMSGLEVVDTVRGRGDRTPVILMVSHSSPTVLKGAAMRGIAVVEKPLFGHALLDAIRLPSCEIRECCPELTSTS